MDISQAYELLYSISCYVLAACVLCILVRAVLGPRVADRIIAVNMVGTEVIMLLSILCFVQKESYLADICIIYAMLSFLTVVVLTKIYTGVWLERHKGEAADADGREAYHDR